VILAFSGTSNARLAVYDIKANQARYQTFFPHHKKGLWRVHDGFQTVFQGVRASARTALREAIERLHKETGTRNGEWDLVLTAHSLGTAISYLFLLDILHEGISPDGRLHQEGDPLPLISPSVNITIASFGPPRLANPVLVQHFHELTREFRERRGREAAFTEWTVIGHNDGKFWLYAAFINVKSPVPGVPALPPVSFGFAHMASNPFYLHRGILYKVPASEKEHGHFHIDMATVPPAGVGPVSRPLHPKGGHNYYAGRDMEKLQRRLKSIAADIAKAACRPVDIKQPYTLAGQKETKSLDSLRRRRHSSSGPNQLSYSNISPSSSSRELVRTTSEEGQPRGNVIRGGLIASISAGVFRKQIPNKASMANANDNRIDSTDIASGEAGQDACSITTSPIALLIEGHSPLPPPGPGGMDPPWVALYLAREQAEDQLWEEKLTRSTWGPLRGVVGFIVAGKAKDREFTTERFGDGMMEKTQTA
jgi:hypothetical protein